MPLTAKGKKLKKKFREQYGKKKGDSVFYAMENSGKLKKVIKARGGDAARAAEARGNMEGRASPSGDVDRSAVGATSEFRKNVLQEQRKKAIAAITPSTTKKNKAIALAVGMTIPGGGFLYKSMIDRMALGYGKAKKTKKTPVVGGEGGGSNKQKTVQPIQALKPIDKNLIKPKDNFFNFVAYKVGGLSGGVSYGPPPKRGPNPQVPPVKMKKGGYK